MPFLNVLPGHTGSVDCGLVYYLKHLHIRLPVPVPLAKVELDVKVVNFVSEIQLTQQYVNKESRPIEAVYLFPVEEESAVVEFEAYVDGCEIKTEVKEKEIARKEYQEAVAQWKTAFLLEEVKSDVFEIKLGHLKPGSTAKVVIKYISELPVEGNAVRLTIPTTIAPRYTPPTDNTEEAMMLSCIKYASESPAPLMITANVYSKGAIKSVKSPTHPLISLPFENEDGMNLSTNSFVGNVSDMNKDFILMIECENIHTPVVHVERSSKLEATAAMVSLVPEFKLKDQKTEMIFLVDRSGSMGYVRDGGWFIFRDGGGGKASIEQAQEALKLFLHSLPVDCFFNIISFGSCFDSLFPESTQYTDETLDLAKSHVASMTANYGGTEIYSPMQAIFQQRDIPGYIRQVFVLTDGAVSNDDQVIKLVRQNSNRTRVFSLGLGSSASRHLVKGVARAGNGTSVFSIDGEDLRPKVMKLLKNSLQPSISDVKVEWKGENGTITCKQWQEPDVETKKTLLGYMKPKSTGAIPINGPAPAKMPPVYDGQRLLAFCLFPNKEKPTGVTIAADSPDGPLVVDLAIKESDLIEGEFVHQLAARKKIQDLEETTIADSASDEELKKAIVKLGITYSLASKHTSFVGVDRRDNYRYYGMMTSRSVQNQVPTGFGGNAIMNHHLASRMQPAQATMSDMSNMPASGGAIFQQQHGWPSAPGPPSHPGGAMFQQQQQVISRSM
jgi:hypothetical protein